MGVITRDLFIKISPHQEIGGGFLISNMIKGDKKINISQEAILSRISEYDIYRYYMPHKNWRVNEVTYSPFRNEKRPSFLIGNKPGFLFFIDFGDSTKRGNCFTFVMLLFGMPSMFSTLKLIDRDFGLGFYKSTDTREYEIITKEYVQPEIIKKITQIQVVTRRFTNEELQYWNKYHLSEHDLVSNSVYGVKRLYLNKSLIYTSDLTFGYLYNNEYWKIYRPYAEKKVKWVPNNVPNTMMDGLDDIKQCDVAIINKSKKDYMVMKKVFPTCCAVQNENSSCFSEENVTYLKNNSKKQVLSFDSDDVGVKNSKIITKTHGFGYINVPRIYLSEGIKDWSDLACKYGLDKVADILKTKI